MAEAAGSWEPRRRGGAETSSSRNSPGLAPESPLPAARPHRSAPGSSVLLCSAAATRMTSVKGASAQGRSLPDNVPSSDKPSAVPLPFIALDQHCWHSRPWLPGHRKLCVAHCRRRCPSWGPRAPVRGHSRWRGPAGQPRASESQYLQSSGRGEAAGVRRAGRAEPDKPRPGLLTWGRNLGSLTFHLGFQGQTNLCLWACQQLLTHPAGLVLGWGPENRPYHDPGARGLGPPSPLVYPWSPSERYHSMEGR